jgi:hypothetical protein
MISNVMKDLKEFVFFYLFIMSMLSLILGILGVGNLELISSIDQKKIFTERANDLDNVKRYPGDEYKGIPFIMKNFLIIMRFSLGDFDFEAIGYL